MTCLDLRAVSNFYYHLNYVSVPMINVWESVRKRARLGEKGENQRHREKHSKYLGVPKIDNSAWTIQNLFLECEKVWECELRVEKEERERGWKR